MESSEGTSLEELLGRILARGSRQPRNITEWMARQSDDGDVYGAVVDGAACPCGTCGKADGIAIKVFATHAGDPMPPTHRIAVCAFDFLKGNIIAAMSAEQAKTLVNRLGEAIAAAERVDAGV